MEYSSLGVAATPTSVTLGPLSSVYKSPGPLRPMFSIDCPQFIFFSEISNLISIKLRKDCPQTIYP